MTVEFHPAAAREVEDAQAWYEERSVFAAAAFLRELSVTIQKIRSAPQRYPPAEGGTRRILVEHFPFFSRRTGPRVPSSASRTTRRFQPHSSDGWSAHALRRSIAQALVNDGQPHLFPAPARSDA